MNKILTGIVVLLIIGGGVYLFVQINMSTQDIPSTEDIVNLNEDEILTPSENDTVVDVDGEIIDELTETETATQEIIGQSVEGRDIIAYHFGTGDKNILLVGGIHGGYAWNTALLARKAIDHFTNDTTGELPENIRITIIPTLNPDGLSQVIGDADIKSFTAYDVSGTQEDKIAARFNANKVDLNRNFDCRWQTEGVWKDTKVSGGSKPFSEPESNAIKTYILNNTPDSVVVWYSSAGRVYASACEQQTTAQTLELTNIFSDASGYTSHKEFGYYDVTGDMTNWLAKQGITAISVLLTDKENTDWEKNKRGIEAIINHMSNI